MIPFVVVYLTVGVMTVIHSRIAPKKPIDILILGYCVLIGPPVLVAAGFVRLCRWVMVD